MQTIDFDSFDQIHLIKLKLATKITNLKVRCPYHDRFTPTIKLNYKSILYIPLIKNILIFKQMIHNSKNNIKNEVPVNIQPMLQYPFDKHNIKINDTNKNQQIQKNNQTIGIFNIHLQFSLFLTSKGHTNYVDINFKQANLKKEVTIFGKMNPYILITNDQWKHCTRQVKDGHLNPYFNQQVSVPFNSIFDKIIIEIRHNQERIGYETIYVFELFGKQEQKQLQLKKQFKIVGTLIYSILDFDPQDF